MLLVVSPEPHVCAADTKIRHGEIPLQVYVLEEPNHSHERKAEALSLRQPDCHVIIVDKKQHTLVRVDLTPAT